MEPNKIYILHDISKTELTPEEAKEQLSDTELPPNMKKIIEGVGKMALSKLEEIKFISKNKGYIREFLNIRGETREWKGGQEDIEYLLSRLAIAEKSLEDAKHKSQILASHCAHRMDSGGTVQTSHAFEKTQEIYESLEKAIQQIRE